MIEIILSFLSVLMITNYIVSSIFCALNLYFNHLYIDKTLKNCLYCMFFGTLVMMTAGIDWIMHKDFMKVPLWQALSWGILHITLPLGYFYLNVWICQNVSRMSCEKINEYIISMLNRKNLQKVVGYNT